MGDMKALRFGILGAARIAPTALIRPAQESANVNVTAVAARDQQRAKGFCRQHGIGAGAHRLRKSHQRP